MTAPVLARERELADRLRRMRWFATALLAAMATLFVAASVLVPRYPALGAVRAFAESALIGGFADWFAVSALFRRPLGLPIPHTAIIPARKNDIGRALARFIRDHFLVRETVEARLERTDLAARLGAWLEHERNAALLDRDLAAVLDWLLRGLDGAELRSAIGASLRTALDQLPVNRVLATLVEVLTSGTHAQTLIDQVVQFGREQLDAHRVELRLRIHDRSPWWLPKFVDQEIYDQLVTEFERILDEIAKDPRHPARIELNARLHSLRDALASDPQLIAKGRALQEEFVGHPAVRSYAHDFWQRIRDYVHASLDDPQSPMRLGVQKEIRSIGATLRQDAAAGERLNGWLRQLLVYFVEHYRDPLSEIISETVERWDPSATAERIELHIGRDLQFIRVNGTLVGGLIGLAIYGVWHALTT
jgi:uncharacterized membrane-anchored protein YjiN (DUF445 family)